MRLDLYADLYHKENTYFWHQAKRHLVKQFLPVSQNLKILDIGCGAGKLVEDLSQRHQVWGLDKSIQAVKFCKKRGLTTVYQDSFPAFKKTQQKFDLITSLDVLEHVSDDKKALKKIKSFLYKNGHVIITVPAYPWLFSYWDKILGHHRRYSKKVLNDVISQSGLKIIKLSYIFSFLLLPVIFFRLIRSQVFKSSKPQSDFIDLPKFIHQLLFALSCFEQFLLRYINLPFGLSIVVVAQKS